MAASPQTPRFADALRRNASFRFFVELWLSVYNAAVDLYEDFDASTTKENIDLTTKDGYATISQVLETVEQTSYNSTGSSTTYAVASNYNLFNGLLNDPISGKGQEIWQAIPEFTGGCTLGYLTIKVANGWATGADTTGLVSIYDESKTICYAEQSISVAFTYLDYTAKDITVDFRGVKLPAGKYRISIKCDGGDKGIFHVFYQNSDVQADAQMDFYSEVAGAWTYNIGDIYYSLQTYKYAPSAKIITKMIDVGATPEQNGVLQIAASQPTGTILRVDADAYTSITSTTPAASYPDAKDGSEIAPYRYWKYTLYLSANAELDAAPAVDMVESLYPRDRLFLRESDKKMFVADKTLLKKYHPVLENMDFTTSTINLLERVATGGEASAVLSESQANLIPRIVSGYPLYNSRAILYMGFDTEGFAETDLYRYFIGTISAGKVQPKYDREVIKLPIKFKNSIAELTRKCPVAVETGAMDESDVSISYDATRVVDAATDLMRNWAEVPGRAVNTDAIEALQASISSKYVIRRSANSKYGSYQIISITPNSNTGSGIIDRADVRGNAIAGTYIVSTTDGTNFDVTNPSSSSIGTAVIDTDFVTEEIVFKIVSGDTAFVNGDSFSIVVGTPDTRITSADELKKHLPPLCLIGDFYVTEDDQGRITFIAHPAKTATASVIWAHKDLVYKQGMKDVIPIYDIQEIDFGWDSLLYNGAILGSGWDGSGSDWSSIYNKYAYIHAQSADDYAQGVATYLSIYEKPMLEAAKYLGPETGYNGDTISKELTEKIARRFAYPPVQLIGVAVPNSEFLWPKGTVIEIRDPEFAKYKRRGYEPTDTLKCMLIGKKLDRTKDRTICTLVELT